MTRLQKKCFMFSAGMHGLLLVVLVASSAFSAKPAVESQPILTMIPANIVDRATAMPAGATPRPQPAPPAFQPPQPAPQVVLPPPPVPPTVTQPPAPSFFHRLFHPDTPRETTEPLPLDKEGESTPKPTRKKPHEVVPTFTPAKEVAKNKKIQAEDAEAESAAARHTQNRRLKEIARTLGDVARTVKTSGAPGTAVDMPGQNDGPAFADYKTVIYNYYYHAWVVPDSVANNLAATDVKIVVARDGTILSSEIINRSGERALDTSVERVLRVVTKLPPFPAASQDQERTFLLRFDLTAKEGSG
jgi:TonB family protein